MYVKKEHQIAFVDFCSTENPLSPTSQLYGVSIDDGTFGPNAIHKLSHCAIISPLDEDNENVWKSFAPFLGHFKCARLQGSNYYDSYVVRFKINVNEFFSRFDNCLIVKNSSYIV